LWQNSYDFGLLSNIYSVHAIKMSTATVMSATIWTVLDCTVAEKKLVNVFQNMPDWSFDMENVNVEWLFAVVKDLHTLATEKDLPETARRLRSVCYALHSELEVKCSEETGLCSNCHVSFDGKIGRC